jgi:predicted RNA-binding protein with RPS1 domain
LSGEEKRQPLEKKRVELSDIDFQELEKRLPEWIKEENEKE